MWHACFVAHAHTHAHTYVPPGLPRWCWEAARAATALWVCPHWAHLLLLTNILASCCCCNKLPKWSDKKTTYLCYPIGRSGGTAPLCSQSICFLWAITVQVVSLTWDICYLFICPGSLSPTINSLVVGRGGTDVRFDTWHHQRLGFHLLQWSHFCNPVSLFHADKHGEGRSALRYDSSPTLGNTEITMQALWEKCHY